MEKNSEHVHAFTIIQATVLFMGCSAGMMIANKLVLRAARLPVTMVMVQMAFTSVTLVVLPQLRATLHFGSRRDVWRWARSLPILFALMLLSSMLALDYASMGAFVVVRNLAPLVALAIEGAVGERVVVSMRSTLPLFVSLAGVLLYAMHDVMVISNTMPAHHVIRNRPFGTGAFLSSRPLLHVRQPVDRRDGAHHEPQTHCARGARLGSNFI